MTWKYGYIDLKILQLGNSSSNIILKEILPQNCGKFFPNTKVKQTLVYPPIGNMTLDVRSRVVDWVLETEKVDAVAVLPSSFHSGLGQTDWMTSTILSLLPPVVVYPGYKGWFSVRISFILPTARWLKAPMHAIIIVYSHRNSKSIYICMGSSSCPKVG